MQLRDVAPPPTSPVPHHYLDRIGARTLAEAFAAYARDYPDYRALIFLDHEHRETTISYGELWQRAKTLQAAFEANGVKPGDVVMIAFATGPELMSAYFGAVLAGAVPALVAQAAIRLADPVLYMQLIGQMIEVAKAPVFYCEPEVAALFDGEHAQKLGRTRLLSPAAIPPCASEPPTHFGEPDDVVTLQFSSGTEGAPKGVMLTNRAILLAITKLPVLAMGDPTPQNSCCLQWIPLYHDMGLHTTLISLLSGAPTVLIPTLDFLRDPSIWLWAIHHYRATITCAPNSGLMMVAKRCRDSQLEGLDLSSLIFLICGAEPVLAHTLKLFQERFGKYGFREEAMSPSWGMAEVVLGITTHPFDEKPHVEQIDRRILAQEGRAQPVATDGMPSVSVGHSFGVGSIEIRDADRRPLPDRRVGEIWVQTPLAFVGYKDDPERTARSLVDGWLKTGDQGYLAEGHLYFISRSKDLIIINGENYAPHDIETVVNLVPGVRPGCVIAFGMLNPERGTEELAVIAETRVQDESLHPQIRQQIRESVSHTIGLGVRHIVLTPPGGIAKTTSGKLARGATRDRYARELQRGD